MPGDEGTREQPPGDAEPLGGGDDAVRAAPAPDGIDEPRPAPVELRNRIVAIDVLRGCALLGILLMNIYAFAYPEAGYFNPTIIGGETGANYWTWVFTHVFVEGKFVTIFSMLFGAGLVLQSERVGPRVPSFRAFYFRRLWWLAVIGVVHAYLIWWGDILFTYAFAGLLIYAFRRRSPRWLLTAGAIGLVINAGLQAATGTLYGYMREVATQGSTGDAFSSQLAEGWGKVEAILSPSPEELQEKIDIYRGGYGEIFVDRAPLVLNSQLVSTPFLYGWRTASLMLIGMALLKLGVLTGARPLAFYGRLAAAGYLIGFPLVLLGLRMRVESGFDFVAKFQRATPVDIFGALLVALGHIAVVMILVKRGALSGLLARLGAVGRMALSNYLLHSVIGTLLFYGYGLGLFGGVGRFALMGFVLGIWILQLAISPLWLARFRFGPAEWLWRSLTYRQRQPMRRLATSRASGA
jgi:uncharacterized protein